MENLDVHHKIQGVKILGLLRLEAETGTTDAKSKSFCCEHKNKSRWNGDLGGARVPQSRNIAQDSPNAPSVRIDSCCKVLKANSVENATFSNCLNESMSINCSK